MTCIFLLSSGYGYSYIHGERNYVLDKPFRCTQTNVSEYLTTAEEAQEINIDEGEVVW